MRFPRSQTAYAARSDDRLQRLDSERLSWRMATGAHTVKPSGQGKELTVFFCLQANLTVLVRDRENRPIDVDSR
jgi:hypothetical protein